MVDRTVQLPGCLGFHEHCVTCDGGLNQGTRKIEAPCLWRSRCYALKLYLFETQTKVEAFIESVSSDVELHQKLAEIERSKLAAIPPPPVPADPSGGRAKGTLQSREVRRHPPPKNKLPDPDRFEKLIPISKVFQRRLRKALGKIGYGWAPKRSMANPGDCYPHRVIRRSNYCTIYLATVSGRYRKVCVLYFKPNLDCINIGFDCDFEEAIGVPGTRLRKIHAEWTPVEWQGVNSKGKARRAAKALGRMIRKGIIRLPEPRPKRED